MPYLNIQTPSVTPMGPYVYTENDMYTNVAYGDSVTANFQQTTTL